MCGMNDVSAMLTTFFALVRSLLVFRSALQRFSTEQPARMEAHSKRRSVWSVPTWDHVDIWLSFAATRRPARRRRWRRHPGGIVAGVRIMLTWPT